MRAIILVGGEGTRMRPLTWRTPKALVPLLGRPLLDHLLLHLKRHGVDHVTLAMTQRNHAIRDAYGDGSRLGLRVDYAYEDTPLGSGGAIASIAQGWMAQGWSETFIVVNGDIVTDLDVTAMLDHHRAKGAVLSISLHEVDDPSPFGVVDLAEDARIRRFVEKPKREEAPSRLINAGTWIFEPSLVAMLDPQAFNRVEDTLFPTLCAQGAAVYGFHRPAYWADVGNPSTLLQVNLHMARASAPGGVHLDPSATLDDGASVEGPAVVGAECHIASGATVRGSVLWDRVTVGRDALVEGSTLASGVTVGAAAQVVDSVVAHGAQVAPGARLQGASVEPAQIEPTQQDIADRAGREKARLG